MAACGDVPPDDEPPRRSIDAGANALTEAAESLTSVPARTNDQECATLPHVPVPGEEPKEAAAHWYRDTATGYRRGRWYDYLLPVTAVLVTGAVITGGLRIGSDFLHRSDGVCHDTWRPTPSKDEVVGLTDGHCLLSESRALRVVEKTIAAQNDQVRKIRHEQPPAMIGSYRRNRVSVSASRLLRGEISSYESACENRRLAVVGSDEETRFISDGTIDVSAYPAVRFYNAAFSDLAYERTGVTKEFADHYREQYGKPADDSGAADAYDAFSAVSMAINAAYQRNPAFHPEVVATNMNLGVVSLNGVTGLISFADLGLRPPDSPLPPRR